MDKSRLEDVMLAVRDHGWEWHKVHDAKILAPPKGDEKELWTAIYDEHGIPHFLPSYSQRNVNNDNTFIGIANEFLRDMSICVLEEKDMVRNVWDLNDFKTKSLVLVTTSTSPIDPNSPVRCRPVTVTFDNTKLR